MVDETLDLNDWPNPVYGEQQKESIEQFAVCKYCNEIRLNHSGDEQKCLFDSTTFVVKKKENASP